MKTLRNFRFVAFVIVLLATDVVMVSTSFAGGDNYSPRLVGMGRAFTASSRGLDAVGVNPANLALDDRNATVTLNLIPLGLSAGSDFINLKIYNDFFTGIPDPVNPEKRIPKFLTEDDKDKLLELFPGGVARTQFKFESAPIGLSLQIGNFGFALVPSVQSSFSLDLEKEYLELPLRGFPANKEYTLDKTAVNGQAVAEVNASFAYILPFVLPMVSDISVGLGIKYLQGLAFAATDHYNGTIKTYANNINPYGEDFPDSTVVDLNFLQWVAAMNPDDPQPVGSGMGYDIGIVATIMNHIQFGASITNIGSIKWDKNTKAIIGRSHMALTAPASNKAEQDQFKDAFKGETVDTTGFEFDLPTAINIGVAVQLDDIFEWMPFRWLVAADGHFGLNEIGGNTKIPQFSIGTEFDPLAGWLPLRTGILIGGRERFAWSAGFGIHLFNTFDLDFATQSLAILTSPEDFRTGSFTMGMRFRF